MEGESRENREETKTRKEQRREEREKGEGEVRGRGRRESEKGEGEGRGRREKEKGEGEREKGRRLQRGEDSWQERQGRTHWEKKNEGDRKVDGRNWEGDEIRGKNEQIEKGERRSRGNGIRNWEKGG
ncbi:hypothetical protein Pcinc_019027 [Petrolisthes cinctipes]|uniref:Uncharacterized protein n=1 Tax=Petrolisthes cinctipes TaxID=88211 RepID=A0AAE1KIA6_PETCI|nr:hypothetical protein Pcinc_019027 [Petrolisthes cinctipes]